ncbi:hypothetical protein AABB02_37680 [Streptomyces rimosus]|uniref:hypothetical protein n=1 Tax=Streptomyces rimosus TaxID=1927 RepID=UPI0031E1EBD1
MTVTGLMCPPTALNDGTCRATSLTVHDLKLRYGPGGMCATAPRLTASGALRLRADHLRGSIFGVLPITFSTRFLPPFPLPYVELTNVTATGLALAADDVHAPHMTFAAADTCNRAID